MVFCTHRLRIRKPTTSDSDCDLFYRLWTDPRVMVMVGFPEGLRITRDEIREGIAEADDSQYDKKLLVEVSGTGEPIGECKLGSPDENGVSETDVKLLPEYWGNGYGTEIKQGLVDYLFSNTTCKIVRASPNRNNVASQKMQTAVGGKRVGEGTYRFPEKMRAYTVDVPFYVYEVYHEEWEAKE